MLTYISEFLVFVLSERPKTPPPVKSEFELYFFSDQFDSLKGRYPVIL